MKKKVGGLSVCRSDCEVVDQWIHMSLAPTGGQRRGEGYFQPLSAAMLGRGGDGIVRGMEVWRGGDAGVVLGVNRFFLLWECGY